MNLPIGQLAKNYQSVLDRIESAATAAGREPGDICLVAVTKYVDEEVVRQLYDLGCRHFGESRPQALWQKAESLKGLDIQWHMIGHLQTNKVRRTLPSLCLLHSGDSLKLLSLVNEEAERIETQTDVLCEVNISGDETKHGFTEEHLLESIESIGQLKHICVKGLMAMASRSGGVERAKMDFERMESLRQKLVDRQIDGVSMDELSMGMSGDFEQAIAHGATLVRVGSVLFESDS